MAPVKERDTTRISDTQQAIPSHHLFGRYLLGALYILSLLFSGAALAQSRLELIHADVSRGTVTAAGEAIRILEGNVHARQDTLDIFCDQAVFHPLTDEVVLTGNVLIRRGVEELTARKVTYYDNRKLAIAEKNVHVSRPFQHLYAEYLEYYYQTDQAYARTNLLLIDEESASFITAWEGDYLPRENRAEVRHNAHFWQIDSTSGDTLHIFARVMDYFFSPKRIAIARESVKILRGDMVALCDSAYYNMEEEYAFLEKNPRARQQNNRLSGKQMELIFKEMKIKKIIVREQALATSVEDSITGKIDRLSGREIIGFIVDDQLDQLWAVSNARSLYYIKDDGQIQGLNTASADTIKVFFKKNEVDYISVIGGSQGVYYPSNYKGNIDTGF